MKSFYIKIPFSLISLSSLDRWRNSKTATARENYLPDNYFMDVETHWGGCGALEWTKRMTEPTKFALGIAFRKAESVQHIT